MKREDVQSLALKALKEKNGGTVVMSPGTGKSKVAIDFSREIKAKKILITSPRTNLKESWRKELNRWGITQTRDDGTWRDQVRGEYISIDLINIQTCYKWDYLEIAKYDYIVFDEIHTMVTEEYGNIIKKAASMKITIVGLTGTPDDKKMVKFAFYALNCPIVYKYLNSAKDGIINKRKYIIFDYELTDYYQVDVKIGSKQWKSGELKQYNYIQSRIKEGENLIKDCLDIPRDTDEYVNYFGWAKAWYWESNESTSAERKKAGGTYMRAISARTDFLWNLTSTADIAKRMANIITEDFESKVLVFSERTKQASKISEYCVHSENKEEVNSANIAKFDSGEITQMGSCYSLTLGLNLHYAKFAIMESYNGSDVQYKQRSGRVDRLPVDEDAIVIFIRVKNTQSETWFKQAITFKEDDIVTIVNSISEFKETVETYLNE